MVRRTFLAGAMLALGVALPQSGAEAKVTPTLKDRFDQILATFLRDPSAGVDIDMKHVLDAWRAMGPKPLETLSVAEARRQPIPVEAAAQLLGKQGMTLDPFNVATKDVTMTGSAGPMKARVFLPNGANDKPRPVVVFYHGGGFVLDNGASTDASSRALAGTSGFIVIAPDYRLAPEAKFPAAQADALAAYQWVLANAASFGGDPKRLALAGEGAGGMLAVDTSMAARDAKLPMPKAQILITPAAGIDMKTASYLQDAAARPWSEKAVVWAFGLALNDPAEKHDPRIDLIGRGNMEGLPPTAIITAEVDPLRSDGERLGGKLKLATVPVEMRDYAGVTHDFFGMGAAVEQAAIAQRFASDCLKGAFDPKPRPNTTALTE